MTLDVGGTTAATGLDDIGVQRALHQKLDIFTSGIVIVIGLRVVVDQQLSDCGLERSDKLAADDLALALRISHTRQCLQEPLLGIDGDQSGTGRRHEVPLHLRPFAGAQQAVIDEHTCQPVADGPLNQCGRHRGIHSPAQSTDGVTITDLLADTVDKRLGDIGRRPVRVDAGEVVQEAAEHLLTVRCVDHLGVVLHPGESAAAILEGRHRSAGTGRHHLEAGRRDGHRVTVTHPHRLRAGQSRMQFAAKDIELSAAVLAGAGALDGAAERLSHGLESVADSEYRDPQVEHARV